MSLIETYGRFYFALQERYVEMVKPVGYLAEVIETSFESVKIPEKLHVQNMREEVKQTTPDQSTR